MPVPMLKEQVVVQACCNGEAYNRGPDKEAGFVSRKAVRTAKIPAVDLSQTPGNGRVVQQ